MNDDFLNPEFDVPEFEFPEKGIVDPTSYRCPGNSPGANRAAKNDRKKAYNKAVQEQLEEESMQEGKIGQRCIGPKRSLEYRAAMYQQTYREIMNLSVTTCGIPAEEM